jgi:hypothetical protein
MQKNKSIYVIDYNLQTPDLPHDSELMFHPRFFFFTVFINNNFLVQVTLNFCGDNTVKWEARQLSKVHILLLVYFQMFSFHLIF